MLSSSSSLLRILRCLLLVGAFFLSTGLMAESKIIQRFKSAGMSLKLELIMQDLGTVWSFVFLDSHTMLITERSGEMKRLDLRSGKAERVVGVPNVYAYGQGGLLDLRLSPNFSTDKLIYFTYAIASGRRNTTRLARARLDGLSLKDLNVLFTAKDSGTRKIHFGSRLAFDDQGHVFMTIGDRGERDRAQRLDDHGGKVIRLRLDGRIPSDNPFVKTKGAYPEIWSYGHRNPQGLSFDRVTGRLWLHEHGPRGGDEINLVKKGANYGWPVITYGREYYGPKIGEGSHKKGMEQPVKYYLPSIAPSGMSIYHGSALKAWSGDLLIGALKLTHLNRVSLNSDGKPQSEERLLSELSYRIRNVGVGPDECVYLSTDTGQIFRISPDHSKSNTNASKKTK